MLRNYFVILVAAIWVSFCSCASESHINADATCSIENCEKNMVVYVDFPPVGEVLDEVPSEINLVSINLERRNWFDAVSYCEGSGQESLFSKDRNLHEKVNEGLKNLNCDKAECWTSFHMLPDMSNDDKNAEILSIKRPNWRFSEDERKQLFAPKEPNRGRCDVGSQACIQKWGTKGLDDTCCKREKYSLCQVTFRSF